MARNIRRWPRIAQHGTQPFHWSDGPLCVVSGPDRRGPRGLLRVPSGTLSGPRCTAGPNLGVRGTCAMVCRAAKKGSEPSKMRPSRGMTEEACCHPSTGVCTHWTASHCGNRHLLHGGPSFSQRLRGFPSPVSPLCFFLLQQEVSALAWQRRCDRWALLAGGFDTDSGHFRPFRAHL